MASTRRLAAILAADVAAYSRLMGADEEGTHERFKAHCQQLVDPKIKEHRGRIVKNTGDGLLAGFASVIDAVRCAVEVQRGMIDRESMVTDERRIRFRIGINLGDVIVEEHDIFGDGVNIAARLEALAEPGGICVSGVVRDQIGDKLPYPFEDMGEQIIKNIARPVRVHGLRLEAVAKLPAGKVPPATSSSRLVDAPRLSIVVLPFSNLSNDPEQQYFADGITEDLTTDLSRLPDTIVISRNTAFNYRKKPVGTKQVGRELCVRYVLEGSVRRSDNRVRVNAQLIDAETDAHLWAGRFNGSTADLLALQDEITSRIAVALNLELVAAEAARPTEHPDALDYILRGRAAGFNTLSRAKYAEAVPLLERALALDPHSVDAQCGLASMLIQRFTSGMSDSPADDIAPAKGLAGHALAASPRSPLAHFVRAQVMQMGEYRFQEALSEYETALSLDRNLTGALNGLGICKLMTGSLEEVIPLMEQAIRLSPRDPQIGLWYWQIGRIHLLHSRIGEAIIWLEKARSAMPELVYAHVALASVYSLNGDTECAATELAEARRRSTTIAIRASPA